VVSGWWLVAGGWWVVGQVSKRPKSASVVRQKIVIYKIAEEIGGQAFLPVLFYLVSLF
jgi:hypothetical protein